MPDGDPTAPAAPDSTARSWEIDNGRLVFRDGTVLPEIDFTGGDGRPLLPFTITLLAPSGWLIVPMVALFVFCGASFLRHRGLAVPAWSFGATLGSAAVCAGLHIRFARRARLTLHVTDKDRRRHPWAVQAYWLLSLLMVGLVLWIIYQGYGSGWLVWTNLTSFALSRFFMPPCQPTCVRHHHGWFMLTGVPRKVLLQLAALTPPRDWKG